MKQAPIFLLLSLLFCFPVDYVRGQNKKDSTGKKPTPNYRTSRVPKSSQTKNDTLPKPPTHDQPPPRQNDEYSDNKPPKRYIIPDTVRPVPVETRTYVRSVLRLQKIYVNEDALELIRLLNPDLNNKETVMSDYRLVLPEFPEPDSKSNRSVNKEFKKDLDPDDNINNLFIETALQLDTLANIFAATNFEINDAIHQENYRFITNLLPAIADLNKRAINKIKHTSRKTVNTLVMETNALNNVLASCNNTSTLSGENISKIYSLIVDMNILLFSITDRKLNIPKAAGNTANYYKPFNYYQASYNLSYNGDDYKSISSDDDPRKFNIYVFRQSLAENGKKDPEMKLYTVSYAIPALAGDKDGWDTIPEPASTVHCYFAPARFNFTIIDNRTGEAFSKTEDLYDAKKDPDEKWTILSLFDRHPTYRLIFLIK